MTIEELLARECIRRTIEKYTMTGDEYDEDRYITCFTEDAILEFSPFPGRGDLRLEGRKAIYEFVSGFFGSLRRGEISLPGDFARHHLTSSEIIFLDSDTAASRSYCLVVNKRGVQYSGIYTGTFRKENGDWLIAHRKWSCPG